MQRFQNPHLASGHMRPMGQQQMPQHQMPQMQQSGEAILLPNGMVMLPNGLTVTPQQAQALTGGVNTGMSAGMNPGMHSGMHPSVHHGMHPNMTHGMHTGMHPNMQYGMSNSMGMNMGGMPTNTGRFNTPNQTVSGGISGTAIPDNELTMGSRFQSVNTQMEQAMVEQTQTKMVSNLFSILVTKGVKFSNNNKVTLNSYYEEIKPSQIYIYEDKITLVECFEEAVESCIGAAHNEGKDKLITLGNFLIENSFYKAAEQEQFNKIILDNDIKAMYKAVKSTWPTLNNKYDIYMFDKFDTIITDTINDFISVNSPVEVNIDSFMSDFNELLKFLRNLENCDVDLEDELITYMSEYVTKIRANLDLNQSELVGIDAEDGKKVTYIPEQHLIAYVDKYSHELGVTEAPDKLTKIDDSPINAFILSTAKHIISKENVFTFYMVTIDKVILQFAKALNGDIFIKKL